MIILFRQKGNTVMAKRCTRCGNFLMDDERFCTRCGENVANIPPEGNPQYNQGVPPQQNYGAPQGQAFQQGQPYPQQNVVYAQPIKDEMSLGKWVGTVIVTTFFGIVSLIFLFVWAFGDGPQARKNYCKAMLIADAISLGIAIICLIVWAGVLSAVGGSLFDYLDRYAREYGQTVAAAIQSFII